MSDPINPSHYKKGNIELIDFLEDSMTLPKFKGYLEGNIVKYVYRYENKAGIQDLEKAMWYLKRLIQTQEKIEEDKKYC